MSICFSVRRLFVLSSCSRSFVRYISRSVVSIFLPLLLAFVCIYFVWYLSVSLFSSFVLPSFRSCVRCFFLVVYRSSVRSSYVVLFLLHSRSCCGSSCRSFIVSVVPSVFVSFFLFVFLCIAVPFLFPSLPLLVSSNLVPFVLSLYQYCVLPSGFYVSLSVPVLPVSLLFLLSFVHPLSLYSSISFWLSFVRSSSLSLLFSIVSLFLCFFAWFLLFTCHLFVVRRLRPFVLSLFLVLCLRCFRFSPFFSCFVRSSSVVLVLSFVLPYLVRTCWSLPCTVAFVRFGYLCFFWCYFSLLLSVCLSFRRLFVPRSFVIPFCCSFVCSFCRSPVRFKFLCFVASFQFSLGFVICSFCLFVFLVVWFDFCLGAILRSFFLWFFGSFVRLFSCHFRRGVFLSVVLCFCFFRSFVCSSCISAILPAVFYFGRVFVFPVVLSFALSFVRLLFLISSRRLFCVSSVWSA